MNEKRLKDQVPTYGAKLLVHSFRLVTWHACWIPSSSAPSVNCLHNGEDYRIEERPGVSRRGHSDA
jgi:hypothetical protein